MTVNPPAHEAGYEIMIRISSAKDYVEKEFVLIIIDDKKLEEDLDANET